MGRSTPPSKTTAPELLTYPPLDLDEDPGDDSIYSIGYRTRGGAIIRDGSAQPEAAAGEEADGGAPADPPRRS